MLHMKYKIERVTSDDAPNRCQATIKSRGQCFLQQVPGSKYCPCHGGNKITQALAKKDLFRYKLAVYQSRLDDLTDAANIKNLRDEIAILRLLINNIFKNDAPMQYSTVVSQLIAAIESLAMTCLKVEYSLEDILDHQDAVNLAHKVLITTQRHVDIDTQMVEDVSVLLDSLHKSSPTLPESNYKLDHWQAQLLSNTSHARIISLRGEIGVLRLFIEDKLNAANTDYLLFQQAGPICEDIKKIEKLVASCHRMESVTGLLLTADEATSFTEQLISIISVYVTNSDALTKIAEGFQE